MLFLAENKPQLRALDLQIGLSKLEHSLRWDASGCLASMPSVWSSWMLLNAPGCLASGFLARCSASGYLLDTQRPNASLDA